MIKKTILYTSIVVLCFAALQPIVAQQRVIPLLEAPASAQSLSMGSTNMLNANEAYIYTNPTSIFKQDAKASADYSIGILPTDDQTMLLHTLTTGYKTKKNAFFLGARYFSMGGLKDIYDVQMNPELGKKDLNFHSYAVDLGYAYELNKSLSLYSKLGFANEKIISNMRAYHASVGSFYTGSIKEAAYSVGLHVGNLGSYTYKGESKMLAPLVKVGGTVQFQTTENQKMEIATDYGMFMPVEDYKFQSHYSVGVDYTFFNNYSLRAGSHFGEKNDSFSAGIGVKYNSFAFSFASKIALHTDMNNIYMLGVNYSL